MTRAGFTLAELLIALVLTALSLGVIAEGVRHSLDFQGRIKTVQVERDQITAGLSALRSRLERLTPIFVETTPGAGRPASNNNGDDDAGTQGDASSVLFSGNATQLRFAASDPAYPSTPGLYEYTITIQSTGDESASGPARASPAEFHRIELTRRPLLDLAEFGVQASGAQSWTLLVTRTTPTLSYGGAGSGWHPVWTQNDTYPVRIRLEFDDPSQPALIVAIVRAIPAENSSQAEGELTQ